MQFHVQLLQSSCVGCIVGGFVGRLGWGESGRGEVVSRSTTRFGGSTLASSSLCPTPSSRYSPLQRPHLQYTFHQLLLSLSFSVISLFFYPSSCSSLPVRDAMQFHVHLIAAICVGYLCLPFSLPQPSVRDASVFRSVACSLHVWVAL